MIHWRILSQKRLPPDFAYQIIGFWNNAADADARKEMLYSVDHKADILMENWGKETRRRNERLQRLEWKLEGRDIWKIRPRGFAEMDSDPSRFLQNGRDGRDLDIVERILYTPAEVAVLRVKHMREIIEDFIDKHGDVIRDPTKRHAVSPKLLRAVEVGTLPVEIRNMPDRGNR